MNNLFILEEARDYVRDRLKDETTGHDWWHIYRVTKLAKALAIQEGADEFICELSALFHDLADDKLIPNKEAALNDIKNWLKQYQIQADVLDHFIDIISNLSYRDGKGQPMSTLEGKVVQDADRLDAIGAVGIARAFIYAGSKGDPMYDPSLVFRTAMSVEQYRNEKSTAINHFYEKLLKLKNLMNTGSAKELAGQRHQYMEDYLKQFYSEWFSNNWN